MNEELDIHEDDSKERDYKYYILIFQAIFFSIVLSAALVIKFVGNNFYIQVREQH